MSDAVTLEYTINDSIELNLAYMPFIVNGGLFVPTPQVLILGDDVIVQLKLPSKNEPIIIQGRVVWITPSNALHHVLPGVGVQFTGADAATVRGQIEAQLDKKVEVGGYTYGMSEK